MTQNLTHHRSQWVERLARFGYISKGIVYAIVGLLAVQVAFGTGGRTTDTKGALQTIVNQPFGKFLLALVAIGLIGYVVWRFIQAIQDPEHKGHDAKGLMKRIGYAINGFAYAGLAFSAMQIVMGSGGGGNSNSTEDWTARLLSQPFGRWLVATGGVLIVALGFYQFYKAFSTKFRRELNLSELSNTESQWVIGICRFGLAARGVAFGIIGWFLIQAARQSDASAAGGLDQVLQTLAQQPYGTWLLGIMAFGLVAYGIYEIVQARYRQLAIN
ncbi:DUF1206 domain-containing protein [Nostocaceae cyanobacterium CENA357]|uniref:DUF1206 domain-containing protein n=1 Tax=Atlanticothrix silvestris CENA357 TaxID=1725252 RepID=A0A8J7HHC5_9CYAN|nr:DUF1206 domain-containing protein [Atlanticothrix silvestris]MBH8555548.1 DUF1206 domain-containing protein [Atlanticothrix silvestris CENA357]